MCTVIMCGALCYFLYQYIWWCVSAAGHNAPHYVVYSSIRTHEKKSWSKRGKVNCCKIWPLGKHDHLLKPHYLVISERGLLLVFFFFYHSGRCERQGHRERDEKPEPLQKSVPAISAGRPSHHDPTEKTLHFSAADSTEQMFSLPWMQQLSRVLHKN